ncbi:MAG: DEAD/DEAH box helicase [Myxococcales bacterium]|nr:DEAD/DEAH box helicase [Myxococcales bacterium]
MSFSSLGLIAPLLASTAAAGHTRPTPIQLAAIPPALEGRDVLGLAQTGTGKTAAFVLPILQRLFGERSVAHAPTAAPLHSRGRPARHIRALVLSPTRELAAQIEEQVERYGGAMGVKSAVIFGGVGQGKQVTELRGGIDILVATPGRLEDLLQQRLLDLGHVEVLVLDEADRMLDVGFLPAIRRVVKLLPSPRQTLFFSATMPSELEDLVGTLLKNPARAQVAVTGTTAARVEQCLYHVDDGDKRQLLSHILRDPAIERAVVFTRTKHGADRVAKHLLAGMVTAAAIHGNKSQNARERALDGFRDGKVRILVATDLASRGIDVLGITHVINLDLPHEPEVYVHRIGRTARAGASGAAISFCGQGDRDQLRDIERLLKQPIPVIEGHPYALPTPVRGAPGTSRSPGNGGGRSGGDRSGNRNEGGRSGGGRSGGDRSGYGREGDRGPGSRPPAGRPAGDRAPSERWASDRGPSHHTQGDRSPPSRPPISSGDGRPRTVLPGERVRPRL